MKRKGFFLSLLFALALALCAIGLAACGDGGSKAPHKHKYSDEWKSSADGHWHPVTCGHEDAIVVEDHEYSGGVCTVCHYVAMDAFYYEQAPNGSVKITGLKDKSTTRISILGAVNEIAADVFKDCAIERVDITDISDWLKIEFGNDYSNPLRLHGGLYVNGTLLEDLIVPSGITEIKEYAFYNYDMLNSVSISDSVIAINEFAFENCNGLLRVELGSGLTELRASALSGCRRLAEVCNGSKLDLSGYTFAQNALAVYANKTEPTALKKNADGYTYYSKGEDRYLVKYNGETSAVVLPGSYDGGSYAVRSFAFYENDKITSVDFGNGVTAIGESAFYGCASLNTVTVGTNVAQIGDNAFMYCYELGIVYNNSALDIVKGADTFGKIALYAQLVFANGVLDGYDFTTSQGDYEFAVKDGKYYLTRYSGHDAVLVLPDSINGNNYEIGASAFYGIDAELTKVTVSDGVTAIGDYAFYEQAGLAQMTIGKNVKSIGAYAFYGTAITDIKIPDSVEFISGTAFYSLSIATYTTYGDVKYIGSSANPYLMAYLLVDEPSGDIITVHEDAKSIASTAFYNCSAEVVISDGVEEIGAYAFYSYKASKITVGSGVKKIDGYAFYSCNNITSVYISDIDNWLNIEFGGNSANPCWYTNNDTNLYVDGELFENLKVERVTEIKPFAFYRCASLKTVEVGDSVTVIGKSAFEDCYALESVKIGNSVKTIGAKAFQCGSKKDRHLITLVLGHSVEKIGETAFTRQDKLTELVIPASVKTMDYSAFSNCSGLTSVEFETVTGWQRSMDADFIEAVTDVSSDDLSDKATAAKLLTTAGYYWRRGQ
ncbi:MAG: leucine-rich repeat domain-containing protein [Clostridiales bacterium]|nr:leucine-rich repeat domain-containing protein [Clostridiales bacterium]